MFIIGVIMASYNLLYCQSTQPHTDSLVIKIAAYNLPVNCHNSGEMNAC